MPLNSQGNRYLRFQMNSSENAHAVEVALDSDTVSVKSRTVINSGVLLNTSISITSLKELFFL